MLRLGNGGLQGLERHIAADERAGALVREHRRDEPDVPLILLAHVDEKVAAAAEGHQPGLLHLEVGHHHRAHVEAVHLRDVANEPLNADDRVGDGVERIDVEQLRGRGREAPIANGAEERAQAPVHRRQVRVAAHERGRGHGGS